MAFIFEKDTMDSSHEPQFSGEWLKILVGWHTATVQEGKWCCSLVWRHHGQHLWGFLIHIPGKICLAEENCLQLPYLQKTEVQTLPCQARFSVICLNLLFQYCLPLDYLPTQVYPPADTKGYFLNILVFLHISVFGCIFFLFLKLKILLTSKAQVGTSFYKEFPSPHSKPN